MPYAVKSTQEWFDLFISNYQTRLNQNSPLNDRSFLEVTAMNQAAIATSMQKYGSFQARQNLALTAEDDYLTALAKEKSLTINNAVQTALTCTVPASDGVTIPVSREYTARATGLKYRVTASTFASGGNLVVSLIAKEAGSEYNLSNGSTLTISSQVAGASSTATITASPVTGTNGDSEEVIRQRVLRAERVQTGGGNLGDYRVWGEEVAGVLRVYPFTGPPVGGSDPIEPPWRTVFVESTPEINPDGIPPQSLLDQVRQSLRFDSEGKRRDGAGMTNQYLKVEPITRTPIFVRIFNLNVDSAKEVETKANILNAVTLYFRSILPFIAGLDSLIDKNDRITDPGLSEVINNVVRAQGGTITGVSFGTTSAVGQSEYQVQQSNLVKLADNGIDYVG